MKYLLSIICILFSGNLLVFSQIKLPGSSFEFTLPQSEEWSFVREDVISKDETSYLYIKKSAAPNNVLLKIYIVANKDNLTAIDLSLNRFIKNPFQTIEDYTDALRLPNEESIGYIGEYYNKELGKTRKFSMIYFCYHNSCVEFCLESDQDDFAKLENEFQQILFSISLLKE